MATCPMPWFPMYASELLSDGDFQSWSPAARGCWLTLSARCWMDGSIPSNLATLARLCGENVNLMKKHWIMIGPKFPGHPDLPGRLFSRRIETERMLSFEKAEKLSKRGEKGALTRWAKAKHDPGNAKDMLEHDPGNAKDMLADATFTLHPKEGYQEGNMQEESPTRGTEWARPNPNPGSQQSATEDDKAPWEEGA